MTLGILEQRILDLAKREPGARPAKVNEWAEYWGGSEHTGYIAAPLVAQLVYKLRAHGLLRPHDPQRPGLYLS